MGHQHVIMNWDSSLWEAEVDETENELRITFEGKCSDISDELAQELQEQGVVVKPVKVRPDRTKPAREESP